MRESQIIKKSEDILRDIRQKNINIANTNYENASKLDGFKVAYSNYKGITPQLAYAKFLNDQEQVDNLTESLAQYKLQLKDIITKINLDVCDLEFSPSCKKCDDTGYVNGQKCSCLLEIIKNQKQLLLNSEHVNAEGLEYLCGDVFNEENRKTYMILVEKMKKAIAKFPNIKQRIICFSGKPGTGKTYFAKALVADLLSLNFDSIFVTSFSMNDIFLSYHLSYEGNNYALRNLIDIPVLAIDDLGHEPMRTNISNEYLLALLNERNAYGKLTIITTNLTAEQIDKTYSNAVSSRLGDKNYTLNIKFDFEDLRMKRENK